MEESLAIKYLVEKSPELNKKRRGLPGTGKRNDGEDFYQEVKIIDEAFKYSNSLYALEDKIDKNLTLYNAGAGSPLRTKPFPLITKTIVECANDDEWSQYQIAAGSIECRNTISEYLNQEGFYTKEGKSNIGIDNIIFTDSTTEAFYLLLKVIMRPYDVVLFTGPTYGLFAYMPERLGGISKILPLREKDDWLVNPELLEKRIGEINLQMRELSIEKELSYIPQIVAFLNINPSNPTGKVMGIKQKALLEKIGKICKNNGIFVIDDIIYKELCYDTANEALPMAMLPDMEGNIITLMGVSKSYGMAAARAGMIIADEKIIRGIRNQIFQQMDSTPLYAGKIMQAAFCNTEERNQVYENYFTNLRKEYIHKWTLMHALIEGIEAVEESEKEGIKKLVAECCGEEAEQVLRPIPQIRIAGNIIPESGFFVMLDLSGAKGMKYREVDIRTERDVLYFYYMYAYVKLLMGKSIGWPTEEYVARVSFAMGDKDIINMIRQMKNAARKLEKTGYKSDERMCIM